MSLGYMLNILGIYGLYIRLWIIGVIALFFILLYAIIIYFLDMFEIPDKLENYLIDNIGPKFRLFINKLKIRVNDKLHI